MAYLKKILIPTSILVFLKMWNNKSLSYGYEAFTYSFVNSFIHSASHSVILYIFIELKISGRFY